MVDNVANKNVLDDINKEINFLHKSNRMHLNHTHLAHNNQTKLLPKSSILETELAMESNNENIPTLSSLFNSNDLLKDTNHFLDLELNRQMIKVQKNIGNQGCFPFHFDTNGADGRVLTAILYLNNNWIEEYGGELRVYPFPYNPITISPEFNKMVLFSSKNMLHRVLPSSKERHCLTIWLYGAPNAKSSSDVEVIDETENEDDIRFEIIKSLCKDPIWRHFSKWYYQQEWEKSLLESHPKTDDTHKAIEVHQKDIQLIETVLVKLITKYYPDSPINPSYLSKILPLTKRIPLQYF